MTDKQTNSSTLSEVSKYKSPYKSRAVKDTRIYAPGASPGARWLSFVKNARSLSSIYLPCLPLCDWVICVFQFQCFPFVVYCLLTLCFVSFIEWDGCSSLSLRGHQRERNARFLHMSYVRGACYFDLTELLIPSSKFPIFF